jgi:hypothetical protein
LSERPADEGIREIIIQTIKEKNPGDVEELAALVNEKTQVANEKIINQILRLESEGRITLVKPHPVEIRKLGVFMRTGNASWYWLSIILEVITALVVLIPSEDFYLLVYARYVLGSFFVLWLPGYSFIKALFPTGPPIPSSTKSLDTIERAALSIGLSLALVSLVGLFLNYTPWGVRLLPLIISLVGLTAIFATVGIFREYKNQIKRVR